MKTQITIALLVGFLASGNWAATTNRKEDEGIQQKSTSDVDWTWLDAWAASTSGDRDVTAVESHHPEVHRRARRAVDLRTLRRLMSNIALSEFYRLRGLEVLGSLGMGHGKPGGLPSSLVSAVSAASDPAADQEASASAPKATRSGSGYFNFPLRPEEFQQFFGALGRSHFARRG